MLGPTKLRVVGQQYIGTTATLTTTAMNDIYKLRIPGGLVKKAKKVQRKRLGREQKVKYRGG